MTETNDSVTWLTQDAYDRLKAELEHLSGPGRVEIAKKIEAAREEGDLRRTAATTRPRRSRASRSPHPPAHPAAGARPGRRAPADSGVVEPGMVVTIAFDGDEDDTLTFLLGSREDAAENMEVYSPKSPLGGAINGKKIGEQAEYELPNGKPMKVKLLDAKPYTG